MIVKQRIATRMAGHPTVTQEASLLEPVKKKAKSKKSRGKLIDDDIEVEAEDTDKDVEIEEDDGIELEE